MFQKCFYFNLSTLTRQINSIWQKEFSMLGLSPSHGYLLTAMAQHPNASQKELSEIMELDASTITRFIDALAAKRFIKKLSTGKGAQFSLTKRGQDMTNEIEQTVDKLFADMQGVFGKREAKRFVSYIQETKEKLEA